MADDTTTTDTTAASGTTETTQPVPPNGERLFTQGELDRIVADRLARERRGGQQAKPQPQPSEQRQTTPAAKADIPDAALLLADFQDNLDAVTEEMGVKVPVEFKRKIRSLYVTERPTEPNAWLKDWLSGLSKTGTPPATNTTNQQPTTAQANGTANGVRPTTISDKGPAANTTRDVDSVLLDDISSLTSVDIERLQAKHGFDKANAMIAEAGVRHMQTLKLKPDRRR